MQELEIFKNEEFGEIRTLMIDGEPWFVGKDIADILEYRNGSRDINRHIDEEDRRKSMILMEIKIKRPLSSMNLVFIA